MKKTIFLSIGIAVLAICALKCVTEYQKKAEPYDSPLVKQDIPRTNKQDDLHESFRQVGWIKDDRYRVLVHIITSDECRNSPISDIEAKIRLVANNNLQRELNPSSNRNASAQIKKMIDDFGMMIQVDKDCNSENIFFFDIERNNLKFEFDKIKHTK